MAFLQSLKEKLKIGKDKEEKSGSFEVVFNNPKLGLTLEKRADGKPAVASVLKESEAHAIVKSGDIVTGVEGHENPSYDDLVAVAGAIGRPIVIKFHRSGGPPPPSPAGGGRRGSGSSSSLGGSGSGGGGGSSSGGGPDWLEATKAKFREIEAKKNTPPPAPLTDEQRRAQREAALKAAEDRTKAWDKKLAKGKQIQSAAAAAKGGGQGGVSGSSDSLIDLESPKPTSEETKRMVELIKAKEAHTANQLGYNPYEVHMSGVAVARAPSPTPQGNGVAGPAASIDRSESSGSTGGGGSSSTDLLDLQAPYPAGGGAGARSAPSPAGVVVQSEEWQGEEEAATAEIDSALGLLVSQDLAVAVNALKTISKVLSNVATGEEKFMQLKLSNAAIQKKIAAVSGGIELLTAAGFELMSNDQDAVLVFSDSASCMPPHMPLRLHLATIKVGQALDLVAAAT